MKISKERMDALMAERGLTGKELARRAGMTPQTLSTLRTRGTCTPITAGKIASALGVLVNKIQSS